MPGAVLEPLKHKTAPAFPDPPTAANRRPAMMPTNQQPTPEVPTGWPTEPPFVPAPRIDSPAAWARDAQEAARYAQPMQQVVVNHYYAAQRRAPDAGQVFGWVAVGGVVAGVLLAVAAVAVALGLAALAMAVLALVVRAIWKDQQKRG